MKSKKTFRFDDEAVRVITELQLASGAKNKEEVIATAINFYDWARIQIKEKEMTIVALSKDKYSFFVPDILGNDLNQLWFNVIKTSTAQKMTWKQSFAFGYVVMTTSYMLFDLLGHFTK